MSNNYKVHRYTGDIKLLKTIGYTFHKLYARNYKVYNRKDIWIFVKGGCVIEMNTIPYTDWYQVIEFILSNKDKPAEFWNRQGGNEHIGFFTLAEFRLIEGKIYSNAERRAKEKDDESWFFKDGNAIDYDLVSDILLLDKLGKLEVMTRSIE